MALISSDVERTTRFFEDLLGFPLSMPEERWQAAKDALDDAGIEYDHVDEVSRYLRGPDGERLELIADPLRWMYGERVD